MPATSDRVRLPIRLPALRRFFEPEAILGVAEGADEMDIGIGALRGRSTAENVHLSKNAITVRCEFDAFRIFGNRGPWTEYIRAMGAIWTQPSASEEIPAQAAAIGRTPTWFGVAKEVMPAIVSA